jgi:C-terminal processing protease CtpA/Prc
MLGVRVAYLDTGARVTHAFPNTPAWRVGLEPRDVIVSIDGYQIGYVNRRFYEMSTELNYRAGRTGWVRLLVQNCRNDQLVNIDVQLARIGAGFPRERFELPPGARLDQGDESASDGDETPNRKPRIAR